MRVSPLVGRGVQTAGSSQAGVFLRSFVQWIKSVLGGDKRSVALFRVALALTVLGDLVDRSWDLRAHYTDEGVFPRKEAVEYFSDLTWICVHMMSGKSWAIAILFILHAILVLFMLVGYKSKLSAIGVWFLTNSLHCRNILVLHSGDVYLRVCLFWALFLPLHCCWSVDKALRNKTNVRPSSDKTGGRGYSLICGGTLAMVAQVTMMYVSSVYHKTGKEWLVDGSATFYALHLDYFRMPLGDLFLYLHPTILSYATFGVLYWEWLGSVLFFVPWKT